MAITLNFVAGIISIVLSFVTAFFAYQIYKYNRVSRAWLSVVTAFILIIFQTSVEFLTEFRLSYQWFAFFKVVEAILMLEVSALFIIGFRSMKRDFESFDITEKKIDEKLKLFAKK